MAGCHDAAWRRRLSVCVAGEVAVAAAAAAMAPPAWASLAWCRASEDSWGVTGRPQPYRPYGEASADERGS